MYCSTFNITIYVQEALALEVLTHLKGDICNFTALKAPVCRFWCPKMNTVELLSIFVAAKEYISWDIQCNGQSVFSLSFWYIVLGHSAQWAVKQYACKVKLNIHSFILISSRTASSLSGSHLRGRNTPWMESITEHHISHSPSHLGAIYTVVPSPLSGVLLADGRKPKNLEETHTD